MICPSCKGKLKRTNKEKWSCAACHMLYSERTLRMPTAQQRIESALRDPDDPLKILEDFRPEGSPN